MTAFLVIGSGKQGSATALDLLLHTDASVTIVDRTFDHLAGFLDAYRSGGRLELRKLDLRDQAAVRRAMEGRSAILSAAPYYFNVDLARLAIEAGAHFADLGGNTELVFRQKELHQAAEARGVSVVPDCGLAPGMVNILAAEGIRRLDAAESVRIYVGGLPQRPEPPLNYMVVYSLEGALDYYTTKSWILRGGRRTEVEALSEVERVDFPEPIGTLEAFHTAGGISTMPFCYEGRIATMEYKTLRYPGHADIMRPIKDLGLLGTEPVTLPDGGSVRPRDAFIAAVSPRLSRPDGRDLVALRVEVRGRKDGRASGTRWQLVDRYDEERGVTAMMRTTGYSLSVTGIMQVDGRIERKGVLVPDECVPAEHYVRELARRGVVIEEGAL
jgi:lysine 6-dehydrogenase